MLDPIGEAAIPTGGSQNTTTPRTVKVDAAIGSLPRNVQLALKLMDLLLYSRDTKPGWYALYAHPYLSQAVRMLYSNAPEGGRIAKIVEDSNTYPTLRQDLAACFNGLNLYDLRDKTYYGPVHYQSFAWLERTEMLKKYNNDIDPVLKNWRWNPDKYQDFLTKRQTEVSW